MFGYDLKKLAGSKHYGTMAKGEYDVTVEKMEWKVSEAGDNMLVAILSIILAHGKKKVIRDYFNLFNKNAQAAEIASSRLSDFVTACGLKEAPSDARVFEGMQCKVRIGVDGQGLNTVERYVYWTPTNNNEVLKKNLERLSNESASTDYPDKTTGHEYLENYVDAFVPTSDTDSEEQSDFGSEPF